VDAKTQKTISDWKWALRRQELDSIVDWFQKSFLMDAGYFTKYPNLIRVPLNDPSRQKLMDYLIQGKIPEHHLTKLSHICFKSLLYPDESLLRNQMAWGLYYAGNNLIVLNDGLKFNEEELRRVLYREVGRHASRVLDLELRDATKMFERLKSIYPVTFENWGEFFAEIYAWAYAGGKNRDHWAKVFGVSREEKS